MLFAELLVEIMLVIVTMMIAQYQLKQRCALGLGFVDVTADNMVHRSKLKTCFLVDRRVVQLLTLQMSSDRWGSIRFVRDAVPPDAVYFAAKNDGLSLRWRWWRAGGSR